MKRIKTKHLVPTLISTLFTLCTFIVFPANAGPYGSETQQEGGVNDSDIERIQVIGKRPRLYFRKQIVKAEDNFYELYNQLTMNNEFKIQCRKEFKPYSHLKHRVCKANYTKTIRDDIYVDSFAFLMSAAYAQEVKFRVNHMHKKHLIAMATTVNNSQKLKELLIKVEAERYKLVNYKALIALED